MQIHIEDQRLRPILEKVRADVRLSAEDGVALFQSSDILALGYMANLVRERKHGNVTWFNVNRHINPTDVCVASCKLCAFGKRAKDPKAYTWSLDEVWHRAGGRLERGRHGVPHRRRSASGADAGLVLRNAARSEAALSRGPFEGVHHGGGRLPAQRSKLSIRETLTKLMDAGVDSLPGGGAEIFSDRVRRIICDHKIDGNQWLDVARAAHQLGLKSNCTMLYGHIETEEDRVDHLVKLRALQDDTGGFQTFIPLAFHPANTALEHISTTTGFLDLKMIAVSRLMLDNISHIKAYWIMMTPRIAQIAQRFGSDDLDGTGGGREDLPRSGRYHQPRPAAKRVAAADSRGRPRAHGTRYAVPAGDEDGDGVHGVGFRTALVAHVLNVPCLHSCRHMFFQAQTRRPQEVGTRHAGVRAPRKSACATANLSNTARRRLFPCSVPAPARRSCEGRR